MSTQTPFCSYIEREEKNQSIIMKKAENRWTESSTLHYKHTSIHLSTHAKSPFMSCGCQNFHRRCRADRDRRGTRAEPWKSDSAPLTFQRPEFLFQLQRWSPLQFQPWACGRQGDLQGRQRALWGVRCLSWPKREPRAVHRHSFLDHLTRGRPVSGTRGEED